MEVVNALLAPIGRILTKLPGAIFNLIIGYLLIQVLIFLLRRFLKICKFPADLRGLVISVSKAALWVILIVFIASSLGFDKLAFAISGSAVVLVFFLNTSAGALISDLVAGFFLIGDPDFKVGMRVLTNDGKTEGVISGIDMRKVRIKDDKGKLHILPNSVIEKGEWVVVERKTKSK